MTPERWAQIKDVLHAVLELEPAKRPDYLDRACANDPALRQEVESYIVSYGQIDADFLKTIVPESTNSERSEASPSLVGRPMGPYRVVEEIGAGGMGEVYRAARADDQFQKQVAIKIVRRGFDTESGLRRFKAERQILASLDHPNIARLLDSGSTEDGLPYVVMELVEGRSIDEYCEAHKLSLIERLELFRLVCAAVHYAHQHLVVHRDLKPSNILVTDGGIPKLLDFGIAKLLGPEIFSQSPDRTATLMRVMTPEFASPEQVRGESITTASDVYSLGVILYRLLTGSSPYRGKSDTPHEIAREICESVPQKPSTAVTRAPEPGTGEESEQTPMAPRVMPQEAKRQRRRLAGDVDNIVLMALRKEPQRRYVSVAQFSEDIRRHLEGLTVVARKDTIGYRTSKFVARHKLGVTAAVLAALTLVAGVVMIGRQARIAQAQRARAEKRFEDVRQFSNSLIFEIHDAVQKLPGATPVRKLLLDRGAQYLDNVARDAGDSPDIQRELAWAYQRLATVQGDTSQANLGEIGAAQSSTNKALALFAAVAKANPHNVADQLNLALAYRTRAFFDIYDVGGSKEIAEALAVTDPLMQTDGDKLEVKNERALEEYILAEVQDATGNRIQAVDSFRKHRDLLQEIARIDPDYRGIRRSLAKATVRLGFHLTRVGSFEEGMQLLNEGVVEYEILVKSDESPDLKRELSASSKGRRGIAALMKGDVAAARADFRSAQEMIAYLAKLDPKNVTVQADQASLDFEDARAIAVGGRLAEALPALQRALQRFQSLGTDVESGPGSAGMLTWIGEAQAATNKRADALRNLEKAAKILAADQSIYDDARCDLAMVQTKIAAVLLKMGKLPEAAAEYAKALETANLEFSLQRMDLPALYAAADAYAGIGDVAVATATGLKDPMARSKLWADARASYEKSLNTWKQIPNPSRINGNEYPVGDPKQVALKLASLR
jgi:serine/threonine protein kinase/tetratricopeptide (TPR) repeat protein